MSSFPKFEQRPPSAQNALDLFSGHWASSLDLVLPGTTTGSVDLFVTDPRPRQAAEVLGRNGRFDNYTILELGPLEAGHTYQLEQLGAQVIAIEANAEAYLKCLIVKELLDMKRSRFLFGDFAAWFAQNRQRFDLVFASGVLYHLADPVTLIHQIAQCSDRCFVWTHYFDPANYPGPQRTVHVRQTEIGEFMYHELAYGATEDPQFWGGNKAVANWLGREDLLRAFTAAGFNRVKVLWDEPQHPNGACVAFSASK